MYWERLVSVLLKRRRGRWDKLTNGQEDIDHQEASSEDNGEVSEVNIKSSGRKSHRKGRVRLTMATSVSSWEELLQEKLEPLLLELCEVCVLL